MNTTSKIEIESEELVALRDLPRYLPKRNGKKVHYSTVFRWALKGCRGRKLESTLVGGVRYTSLEALHRFHAPEAAEFREHERQNRLAEQLAKLGV